MNEEKTLTVQYGVINTVGELVAIINGRIIGKAILKVFSGYRVIVLRGKVTTNKGVLSMG